MKIINKINRTIKITMKNKNEKRILFNIKSKNGRLTEFENITLSDYDTMTIAYQTGKEK